MRGVTTYGYSALVSGSPDRSGYVEFRDKAGARHGYVGWGNGGTLDLQAENGFRYNFNVPPTVSGAVLWHPGNFDPATKLGLATAAW